MVRGFSQKMSTWRHQARTTSDIYTDVAHAYKACPT
jgi:hypothetical protein